MLSVMLRWLPRRLESVWRQRHPDRPVVGIALAGYHESLGGVGNYAMSLLRAWPQVFPFSALRIFCSKATFASVQKLPFRSRIEHRFLQKDADLEAVSRDCDVVYFPCAHLDPVPPPKGTVFFLPDVQEWFFPGYFSGMEHCRRRNRYRTVRNFAKCVIVPSEFTRKCVVELLGFPADRVQMVPNLCGDLPARGTRPGGLRFPSGTFAYYPADDFLHKNHARLLEALGLLESSGLHIPLVCTGSRYSGRDLEALAGEAGVEFQHLGRVTRGEVRWLFDNSRAMLYPSLFEGFGIPLLEALLCSLPIACSKVTSIPEVTGDVAEYFDPFSSGDIARGIRRVWLDESRRKELISKSAGRAAKFSRESVIREHELAFQKIKFLPEPDVRTDALLPTLDSKRAWATCAGSEVPPDASQEVPARRLPSSAKSTGPTVHFFTIVLNGMPFVPIQWEIMKRLRCEWHWHIVEGVAGLENDTAWSVDNGGTIPKRFQSSFLSDDGTREFLDQIAAEVPDRVHIYRKEGVWNGKIEMCRAPLRSISTEVLLWQLDADEIWDPRTIEEVRNRFAADADLMAAQFRCRFFVAPDLVLDNAGFYGNDDDREWRRVWRYRPGDNWLTHEPPALMRDGMDLFSFQCLKSEETHTNGWSFDHFAYVTGSQLAFKEDYYGYRGAVEGWNNLCLQKGSEVRPGAFLSWIPGEVWATRCDPAASFQRFFSQHHG